MPTHAAFSRHGRRTRLLHHLGELLDEERHAAGPVVHLVDQRVRQRARRRLPHQVADLAPGQPVQGQAGLVSDGGPWRLELGAEGEHREDGVLQALGEELRQELEGGRVHPVQVLDDEQHRLPRRANVQPLEHGPKGLFTLPGRRQRQRRVAIRGREREQRRPQRHGFGPGQAVLVQPVQHPVEPGLRRFLAAEGEGPFVEVDGRVESRVLEVWRAAPLDHGCVYLTFDHLSQDVLLQRVDQARLAQSRLADEQHDLPHAFTRLIPATREQAHLLVAAGQG